METCKLRIEDKGLIDVPIYNTSRYANNWCATIQPGEGQSRFGNVDRRFWTKGTGDIYFLLPADIDVGQVIEFAADEKGRKPVRDRCYALVTELTSDYMKLSTFQTPNAAFEAAEELKGARPAPKLARKSTSPTPPARPVVVVTVRNNVVSEVFSSDPKLDIVVIDWDQTNATEKNLREDPFLFEIPGHRGCFGRSYVTQGEALERITAPEAIHAISHAYRMEAGTTSPEVVDDRADKPF